MKHLFLSASILFGAVACSSRVDNVELIPEAGSDSSSGLGDGAYDGTTVGEVSFGFDDAGSPGDPVGDVGRLGDGAACASGTQKVELTPLDMVVVVDTSSSMDYQGKWREVRDALKGFTENPKYANMGMGMQFFPVRQQCSIEANAQPAVPIGILPGIRPAIETALDQQGMSGGTPIVQVLQGMIGYSRSWQQANPARKTVIVLATDGIPDETCTSHAQVPPNSLDNAVLIARQSAQGLPLSGVDAIDSGALPKLPIFVIGVGTELESLHAIANAGGTDGAVIISPDDNVVERFVGALDDIRRVSLSCDYPVPKPTDGQQLDPTLVNVSLTTSAGTELLSAVSNAGDAGPKCAAAESTGWYYDQEAAPTKIVLCPQTCSRVQSLSDARVDVVFGCLKRNIIQ